MIWFDMTVELDPHSHSLRTTKRPASIHTSAPDPALSLLISLLPSSQYSHIALSCFRKIVEVDPPVCFIHAPSSRWS
ncbi:MAG: hypothetical protein UCL14_00220 [Collinsella sp.]|nr:hypothetical protein [Collinsella sp.]